MGLQIVLLSLMLIMGAACSEVPCNYTTPVCDCSKTDDDTCKIQLIIQKLDTFTRYKVTEDGTQIDTEKKRKWYINKATGELLPHEEPTTNDVCKYITEESTDCTQAFTVDGKSMRKYIAVNGHAPGPTLIVKEDQYVVVKIKNELNENTSIHWHGIHQVNSHWMDGVENVTQWGIQPGGRFTYIFQATPSGTHWYHSHSNEQRIIGLFGALIVKEENNKIDDVKGKINYNFEDKPEQHTLTFLDWQNNSVSGSSKSIDGAKVSNKKYWSGIINGKGKHEEVEYIETRLSIFTVSSDNIYRFRLIGAQDVFAYRVSVDEHNLTVIATDGAFLKPMENELDYIVIHSGERYDFLLKTKSHSEIDNLNRSDFMIRAETLEVQPHFAEAILHYDKSSEPKSTQYKDIYESSIPVSTRCTETSHCSVLNCPFKEYPSEFHLKCTHIHKLQLMFPEPDTDVQVDKLFFNFGFEGPGGSGSMNARSMQVGKDHVLSYPLSLLIGDHDIKKCEDLHNPDKCNDNDNDKTECICTHVKHTTKDHLIQMVLSIVAPTPNYKLKTINNFAHPVHLHGHYIQVVAIEFGTYDDITGKLESSNKDINCGGENNCTNPTWNPGKGDYAYNPMAPLKDTVLIPSGGYAVVYFKANNPGYWFIHCHIEPHVDGGMGAIIAEDIENARCPPRDMRNSPNNFAYTVEQFKKDREASCNEDNNNDGDNENNNGGDDGNNNGDNGNNNNGGDDGNNNDEGDHHGEGHDDEGNVVKVEIILIMFLCVGVLWSTN